MTELPRLESISVSGAHFDFHRNTPYEYDETAEPNQGSMVMSSSIRISPVLVVVGPTLVPASGIVPFVPGRLDEADSETEEMPLAPIDPGDGLTKPLCL